MHDLQGVNILSPAQDKKANKQTMHAVTAFEQL